MKRRTLTLLAGGLLLAGAVQIGLRSLGDLAPVEARLSDWPRSRVVRDHTGQILSVTLSEDGEFCLPVLLSDMGRWLPLLAVEVEDRRFRSHNGVDWLSVARALKDNLSSGRVRSGASTITSQIIRLCWPAPRTLSTKLREFAQAMRLEQVRTKDQLLEIYLNMAPMGSNLRGAEAAARGWFGRSARDLTIAQAALLACMIKGPTAYRPDFHPAEALARRNWAISLLRERGLISAAQERSAKAEPLPDRLTPLPSAEWVFCQKVMSVSSSPDITSTLDRKYQEILRAALREALSAQDDDVTAAGVLIENDTGAVRAYVPNVRWGDENTHASWVDCASSFRSPGSALKPFVYAMAFEDGSLSPQSLMADTPLSLSGRAPRNFDRIYRGPVSAASALVDSLNVPAVRALRAAEGERVVQKFRQLGFSRLTQSAAHYGDSLILGGCEVSPLELARAVTALARQGRLVEPRFDENAPCVEKDAFSPQSAWLTTDILSSPERQPTLLRSLDTPRVRMAFKTGTSYGLRDAWTAGWNSRWTLVVWLGDPRGEPHPGLVGLGAAAPAALKTIRALPPESPPPPPGGIGTRRVCSLSGAVPSALCPRTIQEHFIQGISPAGVCTLHRLEKGKVVVVWPKELSAYMESPRERSGEMTIASPLAGASYLRHEEGARLIFRAEGTGEIFWFVDGKFAGSGTAEFPYLWTMRPGRHHLTAVDSIGRQKTLYFSVHTLDKNAGDGLKELEPIE
ncbi:MAG: penicillin-binding protein 1C [Pyramidobacter sp.]|nr:penicillin-binding protein 1C [Pyramidobacter sp.]